MLQAIIIGIPLGLGIALIVIVEFTRLLFSDKEKEE
jgi:hypothetical protein